MTERQTDKALAHVKEHLENAKQDLSLAENIIIAEQKRSEDSKRKEDR